MRMEHQMTRREMIAATSASVLTASAAKASDARSRFPTVGVVLYPWDLSLENWPMLAAKAGINTIGLHANRRLDVLVDFLNRDQGKAFLACCQRLGNQVEYELHAIGDLLSREWSAKDLDLFRVDRTGRRNADSNCCPSSAQALAIIAERAVEFGRILGPTTGRYHYWPDDGRDWCHCAKCKGLAPSDQATIVENAIVTALQEHLDPKATLCHIAYGNTLEPPKTVKPHPALFVEFAPISRVYDRSIAEREAKLRTGGLGPNTHGGYLDLLDANLEIFGNDTAQILEYWLAADLFCGWTRPAKKLPWNQAVLEADADAYAKRGIRHVTSFATWLDADYVKRYGGPPLAEYVRGLNGA